MVGGQRGAKLDDAFIEALLLRTRIESGICGHGRKERAQRRSNGQEVRQYPFGELQDSSGRAENLPNELGEGGIWRATFCITFTYVRVCASLHRPGDHFTHQTCLADTRLAAQEERMAVTG